MEAESKTQGLGMKRKVFGWVFLLSIILSIGLITVPIVISGSPVAWSSSDSIDEVASLVSYSIEVLAWWVRDSIDVVASWHREGSDEGEAVAEGRPEPEPVMEPQMEREPTEMEVFTLDELVVTAGQPPSLDKTAAVLVLSLLISLASFMGFISTTISAHGKDRRESRGAEVAVRKSELELEELRMSIAKSKKKESNQDS